MEDGGAERSCSVAEGRCRPGGDRGTKVGADGFSTALTTPFPCADGENMAAESADADC